MYGRLDCHLLALIFKQKEKKKVIFRLCSIFLVPSADFRPFSEMQVCMKGLNYEYEGKYTLLMSLFHFDLVFFFKVYGLNKLKTFTLSVILDGAHHVNGP